MNSGDRRPTRMVPVLHGELNDFLPAEKRNTEFRNRGRIYRHVEASDRVASGFHIPKLPQ